MNISPRLDDSGLDVSVIVPCYRSVLTLDELVARIKAVLVSRGSSFEIVLVDDGSPDHTWQCIQRLVESDERVRGIRLRRNYGQHNALLAGIRDAVGETIVIMDDDLQHPPEEIPGLLTELDRGFDVVYGTPKKMTHSIHRNMLSFLTKLVLQRAMGAETASKVCAFRAFRRHVARSFDHYSGSSVSIDVLLTWGTSRFSAVDVEHRPRTAGKSNYTLRKLAVYALTMITGFSTIPLRIASLIGISFTVVGFLVLSYVVITFFVWGRDVPGFYFLASVISIFSGAQLLALGVIGEYLARVHIRLLDRPAYTIGEVAASSRLPSGASNLAGNFRTVNDSLPERKADG
jgi:glycosyltransferase involved in cell wall biosynthesis